MAVRTFKIFNFWNSFKKVTLDFQHQAAYVIDHMNDIDEIVKRFKDEVIDEQFKDLY